MPEKIPVLDELVTANVIPNDYQLVSTNNKFVVLSQQEKIVARLSKKTLAENRDDPQDLCYSHGISWFAGIASPVVQPFSPNIQQFEDWTISKYPLLNQNGGLTKRDIPGLVYLLDSVGEALEDVRNNIPLRRLNVAQYVTERVQTLPPSAPSKQSDFLRSSLDFMNQRYPFQELCEAPVLIHGDMKKDNIVRDERGNLMAIDLDAAAIGPRFYDLASWRLRNHMGDEAPIEKIVEHKRKTKAWDEEQYRALIGWKAISSMSFVLRYGNVLNSSDFDRIVASAVTLDGLSLQDYEQYQKDSA